MGYQSAQETTSFIFLWIEHFNGGRERLEWVYEYFSNDPGSGDTHGCGVHPVITLNPQVLTFSGDGSKEKPYELVIDK